MGTSASSLNEAAYGGIADSYASRYGIPADVFRNAISTKTGFNPNYSGNVGKGIAGLNVDPAATSINPYDVGQSLNIAAAAMKQTFNQTGSWSSAAQEFITGIASPTNTSQTGGASGDWSNEPAKTDSSASSKHFWQYTADDVKSFFKNGAWGILISLSGVLLILATIYVLVTKNSDA